MTRSKVLGVDVLETVMRSDYSWKPVEESVTSLILLNGASCIKLLTDLPSSFASIESLLVLLWSISSMSSSSSSLISWILPSSSDDSPAWSQSNSAALSVILKEKSTSKKILYHSGGCTSEAYSFLFLFRSLSVLIFGYIRCRRCFFYDHWRFMIFLHRSVFDRYLTVLLRRLWSL